MAVEAAFEQLRKANPEPEPTALRRQLQDGRQFAPGLAGPVPTTNSTATNSTAPNRRGNMDTRTAVKDPPPVKARSRWGPALTAAVVVAVVAIGVVLINRGGTDLANATPVEIASAYMDARNAFDADRAAELLSADAALNDVPIIGRDELEPGFEMLRLYEFEYSPYECTETGAGQSGITSVLCTYMMNTRISEIVGYPPVDGSINFMIENGRIQRLTHAFNFTEFGPNVFDKFLGWLEGTHPGSFDQLFRQQGAVSTPRLTRESLDLLSGYLDEYDQSVNG